MPKFGDLVLRTLRNGCVFDKKSLRERYEKLLSFVDDEDCFKALVKRCVSCPARQEARAPIPPTGPLDAELVVIGRNPGFKEDKNGSVFQQDSNCGRLFESMLRTLGFSRDSVYITNAMFCHTRKDRSPSTIELAKCAAWKVWETAHLKNMRYALLLGNDAVRQFLGFKFPSIIKVFGDVYQVTIYGRPVVVFPCYHPGYIARRSDLKPVLAEYCRSVRKLIDLDRS